MLKQKSLRDRDWVRALGGGGKEGASWCLFPLFATSVVPIFLPPSSSLPPFCVSHIEKGEKHRKKIQGPWEGLKEAGENYSLEG